MAKQKLVCTAELDLPDDTLESAKAQAGLLEIWNQFKTALPEQGLEDVRLSEHVVKSKAPKTLEAPTAKPEDPAPIPGFLKRA